MAISGSAPVQEYVMKLALQVSDVGQHDAACYANSQLQESAEPILQQYNVLASCMIKINIIITWSFFLVSLWCAWM